MPTLLERFPTPLFLLFQLVLKDFKIRYRATSFGISWAILNPLVFLGVLVFVLSKVFPSDQPHFPTYVLCGLIPHNFYCLAVLCGAASIVDSVGLVKRLPAVRELVPVAAVFSAVVQLVPQLGLLALFALFSGLSPNLSWLILTLVWLLFVMFLVGISLILASLNVFMRDIRYFVESSNVILFWLLPIFYSRTLLSGPFELLYRLNPVGIVIEAQRAAILHASPPEVSQLLTLCAWSAVALLAGTILFKRCKTRFYKYL